MLKNWKSCSKMLKTVGGTPPACRGAPPPRVRGHPPPPACRGAPPCGWWGDVGWSGLGWVNV